MASCQRDGLVGTMAQPLREARSNGLRRGAGWRLRPGWGPCLSRWRRPRPGLAAASGDISATVDDARGKPGEREVVVTRVTPQCEERLVRGHPMPFGQDSLGLLDDDSALQRGLQLLGDKFLLADRSFLQYADGGDIYQRPG